MILELKLEDTKLRPAYLKTLIDTIEELNCKTNTSFHHFNDIDPKTIEIYGSNTMINWLILRMQRYEYMVNKLCDGKSINT